LDTIRPAECRNRVIFKGEIPKVTISPEVIDDLSILKHQVDGEFMFGIMAEYVDNEFKIQGVYMFPQTVNYAGVKPKTETTIEELFLSMPNVLGIGICEEKMEECEKDLKDHIEKLTENIPVPFVSIYLNFKGECQVNAHNFDMWEFKDLKWKFPTVVDAEERRAYWENQIKEHVGSFAYHYSSNPIGGPASCGASAEAYKNAFPGAADDECPTGFYGI